jgi:hypothetical protein
MSDGGDGAGGSPAAGVTISRIAAYQGVEVTLFRNGAVPPPNAPLVIGKELLFRVFLAPEPEWEPGEVTLELTVNDGTTTTTETIQRSLDAASVTEDLATTANFQIPATRVTAQSSVSVLVKRGERELSRWPAAPGPLATSDARGPFLVTLVPLVTGGFGPNLEADTVRLYKSLMARMFPAPDVVLTVREPVTLPFSVRADGTGWDEALDQLYAVRAADDPVENAYYYGVLAPGTSMEDYCPSDCTVGLSVIASANEEMYRGSIGTGFFENRGDTFSPETMAHELGHALGQDHSPCGTGGDGDPRYPYRDGMIGSWGHDGFGLRDPSVDADVMGYCVPVWISDYTFSHLFTRIAYVNGRAARTIPGGGSARAPLGPKLRTLMIAPNGSLRWGREKTPRGVVSGGTLADVELLDDKGALLSIVRAPLARFDHLPGGFVEIPASALAAPGVKSVRVGGRTLPRP